MNKSHIVFLLILLAVPTLLHRPAPPVNIPTTHHIEPVTTPETAIKVALAEPDAAKINALNSALAQERSARLELQAQLEQVQNRLVSLENQLRRSLTPVLPEPEEDTPISSQTFFDAGFDAETAQNLAQYWSEQQMAVLYLQDQARREGWADTPRYREALRELRNDTSLLQSELGDTDYARYLYALGQPNRVQIDTVIGDSPAQIAGLQTGDQILTYDGQPIYGYQDLRQASQSGDPEQPIVVQIERDGLVLDVVMPRGPLGVMLNPTSVLPTG